MIFKSQATHAGIIVRSALTEVYKTAAGQVIKGKIDIQNQGSAPQDVKLYLQDLAYNAKGQTFYVAPANRPSSNAAWIHLSSNLVSLNANESKEVAYEIIVPTENLSIGSYWSSVMIEPTDLLTPDLNKSAVSVGSMVRYAVQIITNLSSEDLKPELRFDSIGVQHQGAIKTLNIAASNTGKLYCRPMATVEIYNAATAEKIGKYNSISLGLLPQNSKTFSIDISAVPKGKYNAVLMATDEAGNAFAVNFPLDLSHD